MVIGFNTFLFQFFIIQSITDAVMDEAGDPNEYGSKYQKYQDVITQFFNITPVRKTRAPKMVLPSVRLNPKGYLLSTKGRTHLGKDVGGSSPRPLSFEELNQFSGFVLYETKLPTLELDPTEVLVERVHDRALVYVDQEYVGSFSRENNITSLAIHPGLGNTLQILVENQGRINYNVTADFKVSVFVTDLTLEANIFSRCHREYWVRCPFHKEVVCHEN